ncbi:MAG: hypothetical protein ACHQ51_14425 [Elusimicrobiota bacterium]
MRHATVPLAIALALCACARRDPVAREFQVWKSVAQIYVPINARSLAKDMAVAAKFGAVPTVVDVKPVYLRVTGRTSLGEGPQVVLYTRQELIPPGTSFVTMARVQAIGAVQNEAGVIGACVDPSGFVCRASLSLQDTDRLADMVMAATTTGPKNPKIPFNVIRRK